MKCFQEKPSRIKCAQLYFWRMKISTDATFLLILYLAIRQRVRVVYERIVNEGEASLIDNEGESSNCFSIHLVPRYINFEKIIDTPPLHRNFQNNLINSILYGRASVHHHE